MRLVMKQDSHQDFQQLGKRLLHLNSSLMFCFWFPSDDLPLRGFIGHLEEGGFLPHTHNVFLWAHLNFNIEFNGDQVHKEQWVLYS